METLDVNGVTISQLANIINRNCLYKRKGWFLKYVEKRWFGIDNLEIAKRFEELRDILDEIHGENWDFFFIDKHSLPKINILYPKLEMTNSVGHEHTIRDIIISLDLYVNSDKLCFRTSIKGHRLTVSKKEYLSSYQHSHLYPTNYVDYKYDLFGPYHFCLGNNEIPEIIATYNDNQEAGTFELLLLTLETMLAWESLEGTPYIKINSLSLKVSGSERYYWNESHGKTIFEHLLDSNYLSAFSYDMDINRIKVLENDFFEESLLSIVINELPIYLCIRVGNNEHNYNKVINNNGFISHVPIYYVFKGQKIPFKIYDNRKTKINKETMSKAIIHPRVYDVVVKNLNRYLYEKCIVKYARENRR